MSVLARLTIASGQPSEPSFAMRSKSVTIGYDDTNDIRVYNNGIAPEDQTTLQIIALNNENNVRPMEFFVRSLNGKSFQLNDVLTSGMRKVELKNNDRLTIGSKTLLFNKMKPQMTENKPMIPSKQPLSEQSSKGCATPVVIDLTPNESSGDEIQDSNVSNASMTPDITRQSQSMSVKPCSVSVTPMAIHDNPNESIDDGITAPEPTPEIQKTRSKRIIESVDQTSKPVEKVTKKKVVIDLAPEPTPKILKTRSKRTIESVDQTSKPVEKVTKKRGPAPAKAPKVSATEPVVTEARNEPTDDQNTDSNKTETSVKKTQKTTKKKVVIDLPPEPPTPKIKNTRSKRTIDSVDQTSKPVEKVTKKKVVIDLAPEPTPKIQKTRSKRIIESVDQTSKPVEKVTKKRGPAPGKAPKASAKQEMATEVPVQAIDNEKETRRGAPPVKAPKTSVKQETEPKGRRGRKATKKAEEVVEVEVLSPDVPKTRNTRSKRHIDCVELSPKPANTRAKRKAKP
ncbi:unnamed protein product [Oppiella nova]|uniref:FHA domain-containing protein n=1 Tax=Oppiella nova TaxID=334625 RepID=A0A7R9MEW4_9ACAR|nr:unnamed protein product [Oppiella nova]CAG2175945.1 unnamed protein product [Oppiella nova]